MLPKIILVLQFFLCGTYANIFNEKFDKLSSKTAFARSLQQFLITKNATISFACRSHLSYYVQNLIKEEKWAIEMFDSASKFPPGIEKGNTIDFGFYEECMDIQTSISYTDVLFGQYCVGTIPVDLNDEQWKNMSFKPQKFVRAQNATRGINLAVCLPNTCSVNDLETIYGGIEIDMVFRKDLCQTKQSPPKLGVSSVIMLSFLFALVSIVVFSTIFDIVLYYSNKKPSYELLLSFSALKNFNKVIKLADGPNQISCLAGLRVLSMMWVIVVHRFNLTKTYPIRNYNDIDKWFKTPSYIPVYFGQLAVDTFFVLGGLVVSYSYIAGSSKGRKFSILRHYIHRYLRLTPVLFVIVMFHLTLLEYVGSGPMWQHDIYHTLVEPCEKHWWRTFLYIQNYGGYFKEMCVGHGWYLSVDMQMFLLSPIFLIPLMKRPKLVLSIVGFLVALTALTRFLSMWYFEIIWLDSTKNTLQENLDYSNYYVGTHSRGGSWLIGFILGYILYKEKTRENKTVLKKFVVFSAWVTIIATILICVMSACLLEYAYDKRLANSFFVTLVHPVWASLVGLIIYLCSIGYGGPINWFLSLPVFQILSKLTYTVYLTHAILIYTFNAQIREAFTYDAFEMLRLYWGDVAYSVMISLIITMTVEIPLNSIEQALVR